MAKESSTKKSLSFLQLRIQLFKENRVFWFINNSILYSEQWLAGVTGGNGNVKLGSLPGGSEYPFSNLNISFAEYCESRDSILEFSRQNSIVNIITAFEEYLSIAYQRAIYLSPVALDSSEMELKIGDVVELTYSEWPRLEFSKYIADKKMRNIPTREMIKVVAKAAISGVLKENEVEVDHLVKYTYLRNAIVHNVRCVTKDLAKVWSDRNLAHGVPIMTESNDINMVTSLCLKIASSIDKRYIKNIIKDEDKVLLVRELFARFGMEESKIRFIVNASLGGTFNKEKVENVVAEQKKQDFPPNEFIFSEDIMEYIKRKNDMK